MQVKQLSSKDARSFAVVLSEGEDPVSCLTAFAKEHKVDAGRFTALGAFSSVTLGFFDFDKRDYERIVLDEQVEVLSLIGNFSTADGETKLHPHVVVGKRNGQAFGGHLLEGRVKPTLEVIVVDEPAHLRRQTDPKTGLPLLAL
ncbi:MAG TPA: PPC domain-containing DNA-binding protein [Devosia sp.]|jgi:hypothetical protein|nr:PPC domain-containing DNA-binding protein [Devosia sp.]